MNRSILIVICDFLLVSLVAFSNFDREQLDQGAQPKASKAATPGQDVMGSLKMALEDEKQTREKLTVDLQSTRQNLQEQQQALAQREARIKEYQENLRKTEEQARQIEQQRTSLSQQYAAAQGSLKEVQQRLQEASTENLISKEKLEMLQNDLKRREEESKNLQSKLGGLEKSYQAALAEKQQLTAQLQVSEAEKRLTREQVQQLRGEVASVQEEKTKLQETTSKLASNVGTLAQKSTELAQKSTELTQEIRENRPLAPNTIFNEFVTNRITTSFEATRSGLLGRTVDKNKTAQGILFNDGNQTYALFHIEDTPLMLYNPGTDWNKLTAVMSHGQVAFSAVRLSFAAQDPRVVVIPIGDAQAKQFHVRIYKAPTDPFKFQEAVIVGANEGYYGECKFEIDPRTPQHVKVDRNFLKGLFGQFNPSRGDLVFSKSGDLLGVMVNKDYCSMLNKVVPSRTIMCGENIASQQTGQLLSQLADRVFQMPQKLQ